MYFNKNTKLAFSLSNNPGINGSKVYNNLFCLDKFNFIYLPREVKTKKKFKEIISIIKKNPLNFLGCSVSMPFKEEACLLSDKKHSSSSGTKSANTLILNQKKLIAFNTDFLAIELILKPFNFFDKDVLILGAGGLSKSFAFYFKNRSNNLFIYNRSKHRFKSLININNNFTKVNLNSLNKLKPNIIINTIPLSNQNEIFNNINFEKIEILFDCILTKKKSALIKKIKNKKIKVFNGLSLFNEQNRIQKMLYLNAL